MAKIISATPEREAVLAALEVLDGGGTVVVPTDTVYGIAAVPDNPTAVDRIFEVKQRPTGMHLAVLVDDVEQIRLVSSDSRSEVRALAVAYWPGALTMVLPAAKDFVAPLGHNDGTVGVRCPDHALVRAIAAAVGPIAVTSANLHGEPTPATAAEVAERLPGADLVIDGGPCPGGVASTVVSLVGSTPKVLRDGPISQHDIRDHWEKAASAD